MRLLLLSLLTIPFCLFGQANKEANDTNILKANFVDHLLKAKTNWTKVEKPKSFEITYFKEAKLMIPKAVIRYYKLVNKDTVNYLSEAIYPKQDYLTKGESGNMYRYYDVTFYGTSSQFSLNYSYSIGRGYSCQGTYFIEEGIALQTDYGYGTTSGTITVTQNGRKIFSKTIDTEKRWK